MGIRYPEGRTCRPREIGGRHVRKEEEWLREGGPEGLRKAHEARAGHGPEDAGAQGLVQGDREGAGQVALDGERRGGVAQVRDGAEVQARRARGRLRRPVGGLPAPDRAVDWLLPGHGRLQSAAGHAVVIVAWPAQGAGDDRPRRSCSLLEDLRRQSYKLELSGGKTGIGNCRNVIRDTTARFYSVDRIGTTAQRLTEQASKRGGGS